MYVVKELKDCIRGLFKLIRIEIYKILRQDILKRKFHLHRTLLEYKPRVRDINP